MDITPNMMKTIKMTALAAIITVGSLISGGCSVMSYGTTGTNYAEYQNPHWAPPYHQGARYYYIPDIETYFDIATGDFIFLYNGRWSYSRQLPSIYATFDLDNCFTVVLNIGVFQPWQHHHYYVSHYPRYYYRDYYDFSGFPYVRGYNENHRRAFYWDDNQRHRARDWNDRNLREKRNFKYSYEDRRYQDIWRENVSGGSHQRIPDRDNPPRDNARDRYNTQNRNTQDRNTQDRNTQDRNNRDRYNQDRNQQNPPTTRPGTTPTARPGTTPTARPGTIHGNSPRTSPVNSNTTPRNDSRDRYNATGTQERDQNRNSEVNSSENREQRTNYYGRPIGNTVKVTRGMQQPQEKQTRESKVNRDNRDNKSTGTTTTRNTGSSTTRKTSTNTSEKDKEQKSTQKSGDSVYRR